MVDTFMSAASPALGRFPTDYDPVQVPGRQGRHLVERFSYGFSPQLLGVVRRRGARSWFERQLRPARIRDPFAAGLIEWYPALRLDPDVAWLRFKAGKLPIASVADDFAAWTLMRRVHSRRQVHEVMTEFWSNLLHVAMPSTRSWPVRASYDATIRNHALGRFDALLEAAVLHPAMLCYLDNDESSAQDLNENLGRELLELHTVGRTGGYSERDVLDSARILTGWTVDARGSWRRWYDESAHYRGRVRVMGFKAANTARDGRRVTRDYLRWLAHHPATARRIAHRLAVRFVADDPSPELVADLARVFRRSGTDIRETLRYLVRHPDFRSSVGRKVRTPTDDYVATCRALGMRARRPQGSPEDFANLCVRQSASMGQRPFNWPRPDGSPDDGAAWSSVARMIGSWTTHQTLAAQTRPTQGVRFRNLESWLPPLPQRFDAVVDHLSRRLLARPANRRAVAAAAAAVAASPTENLTPGHHVVEGRLHLLVASLLDSPAHMTR